MQGDAFKGSSSEFKGMSSRGARAGAYFDLVPLTEASCGKLGPLVLLALIERVLPPLLCARADRDNVGEESYPALSGGWSVSPRWAAG
eukprot:766339-Prorocentrum_minimum.AAC.1